MPIKSLEPRALLLPPGVGNGFLSITKSVYCYALAYGGDYSDFDVQFSLKWNDSDLKIPWKSKIHNPIISDRDKNFCEFNSYESPFFFNKS